jgi:hypothetical protein
MNYVMGDFGFFDQITQAASTFFSNPQNQQQLINAGINLIAPKPPKPSNQVVNLPSSPTTITSVIPAQKDNTMLYVGLGVAGVALVAVVAGIIMAKKK